MLNKQHLEQTEFDAELMAVLDEYIEANHRMQKLVRAALDFYRLPRAVGYDNPYARFERACAEYLAAEANHG